MNNNPRSKQRLSSGSYRTIVLLVLVGLVFFALSTTIIKSQTMTTTVGEQQHILEGATTSSSFSSSSSSKVSHRTTATICSKVDDLEDPKLQEFFQSQDGEDKELLQWFNGLCGGTYVEMGGLDGITYSNTYFFNKGPLQWKGVLVEVNPITFPKLQENRPNEIATVNAAVCDVKQTVHYVNLKSRPVGGIWEFAAPSFRKERWRGITLDKTTPIECLPFHDILLEHVGGGGSGGGDGDGTPTSTMSTPPDEQQQQKPTFFFDFFSLDIEGAELEALRSINLDQVGFGIILVEADAHNQRKNLALRMYLESHGYSFLYEKLRSYWFVNRDFGNIYRDVLHES